MNSTCWKKTEALEEVSESEENIPTESNYCFDLFCIQCTNLNYLL
ncbi:hypothetical protein T10_10948 [Trichinella papuae]|uniref:Uncharacterized protein n=1 Tax=Trichinella papuae TaxID=268474 RepID=A0A0V1LWS9_9BILA|nr:hypothetical protein T10_10948 [Trichinella papuae]